MTDKQRNALEWAKNQKFTSLAAVHARTLAGLVEELMAQGPRWIPVTERMPEVWRNDKTGELVNYMIYSPDFGVDIGNHYANAKKWICMGLPCNVTHWMPLPPAPEPEEA